MLKSSAQGLFRITKGDKKVHPETPKSILSTLLYLLCFMKICVRCLIRTTRSNCSTKIHI
ncbi:unnamed protein product [Brassica oleracea var. botrytis]